MERFTTVSIQNERPKNKGMNGEKIKSILQSKPIGQQCSAQGWVRTFRANRFIALNDGSTIENLQCVVDFEQLDESVLKQILLVQHFTFRVNSLKVKEVDKR